MLNTEGRQLPVNLTNIKTVNICHNEVMQSSTCVIGKGVPTQYPAPTEVEMIDRLTKGFTNMIKSKGGRLRHSNIIRCRSGLEPQV